MATVEEIGQEKQRIAERLARLDAERAKLAEQLNELEIAERVLSRFGRAAPPWRSVAAGDAGAGRSACRRRTPGSRRSAGAGIVVERRNPEGSPGAWGRRHRRRSFDLLVARVRHGGQAESSRYCAAAPSPRRPPRKPRFALAPAASRTRGNTASGNERLTIGPALVVPTGGQRKEDRRCPNLSASEPRSLAARN